MLEVEDQIPGVSSQALNLALEGPARDHKDSSLYHPMDLSATQTGTSSLGEAKQAMEICGKCGSVLLRGERNRGNFCMACLSDGLTCDLCANSKESYSDIKLLKSHIKSYHMEIENQLNVHENMKLYISCNNCQKDFSKEEYFGLHLQFCALNINNNNKVNCPVCKEPTINLDSVVNIQIDGELKNVAMKLRKCEICCVQFYACNNFNFHFKNVIKSNETLLTMPENLNDEILIDGIFGENSQNLALPQDLISMPNATKVTLKRKHEIAIMESLKPNITKTLRTCKHCGAQIESKDYIKHIVCHIYKCPYCQLLQATSYDLRKHLDVDDNVNMEKYQYFLPEETFRKYAQNGVLNLKLNTVYLNKVVDDNLKCNVCSLSLKSPCDKHAKNTLHDVDILKCSNCTTKFSSEIIFQGHNCSNNKKCIECQICDLQYSTVDNFIEHFDTCHNSSEFIIKSTCSYCFKDIGSKIEVDAHVDQFHKDKNYSCSLCGTQFDSKLQFLNHGYSDHGVMTFKCSKCSAQFSKVQYLIQHIVICPGPTTKE